MRKIMRKDLNREIVKTFPRFISIALLIAIGIAFFIGLKSAPKIMIKAGADYLENNHYVDLKVFSTGEITDEDIKEIKKVDLVKDVTRHNQLYLSTVKTELTTKIVEYNEKQFEIVEGREPREKNEILLDNKGKNKYKIGDSIEFVTEDNKLTDELSVQKFEVVGFGNNYEYLGKYARGNATIGDGSLFMFASILPTVFEIKKPNNLSILMDENKKKGSVFSDEYLSQLEKMSDSVKDKITEQQIAKKNSLYKEIEESKIELNNHKDELKQNLMDIKENIDAIDKLPQVLKAEKEAEKKQLDENKIVIEDNLTSISEEESEFEESKSNVELITFTTKGINKSEGFEGFRDNIQRLDSIGNIIPFIFFFVASLITCVVIIGMINQEKKTNRNIKSFGS